MSLFGAMEAEARELTWRAYRQRQKGRLFRVPDIDGSDRDLWPRLDDLYWDKAVGVVAPPGNMFTFREHVTVGVWRGISGSFLGIDLSLVHFSGPGCITHRSPLNIAFIHVLPGAFQRIPQRWAEEDRVEDGASYRCYCDYVYKEDEYPCRCHYTCGGCCLRAESPSAMADAPTLAA